jgi:hypothetical protein
MGGVIPTPVQCYEMFQARPADDRQAAEAWSLCQCMNASWARHMTTDEHRAVTSTMNQLKGPSPEAVQLIARYMPDVRQECPFPESVRSMAANPW